MTTNPMTDREREAFEQYIADVIYEMCDHDEERATVDIASALMPDGNGNYMSTWTCDRLDAWQARIEYEPIEPIVYARKEDIDAIAELEVSHPEQSWSLTAKAKQDAAYSIPLYGAALSTEAQPEVTGAVAWRYRFHYAADSELDIDAETSRWHYTDKNSIPSNAEVEPLYTPSAIEAAEKEKLEEMFSNPSEALLMSMAIRLDHGLGVPGYYDQFEEGGHKKRLERVLSNVRQVWEEVAGCGFYSKEREGYYLNLLAESRAEK